MSADSSPVGLRRLTASISAHRWFTALLLVALVLRVLVSVTYWPALEFFGDSYDYLATASHLQLGLWHPSLYPLFLRIVGQTHVLALVPICQHLFGLAAGALVYRLLRTRGVRDGAATLAVAPFLLDAWQLDIEQFVLSEALFELTLAAGVYVLFRGAPRWPRLVAAGCLLAAAVLARTAGLLPAVIALVGFGLARRPGWRPALVAVFAFVAPLVVYAGAYDQAHGTFALTGYSGRELYGETATFARCSDLPRRPVIQRLCPKQPLGIRPGNNQFTWSPVSPLALAHPMNGEAASRMGGTFASAAIRTQPLSYLRYVTSAVVRYFRPGRPSRPRDFPQAAWQFPPDAHSATVTNASVAAIGFFHQPVHPSVVGALARGLRRYQRIGFTPGPLLLLCLVMAFAFAVFAAFTRRRWAEVTEVLTLAGCGLSLLVVPSLGAGFDYRYLLPALLFLPPAAILGWHLESSRSAVAERGLLVPASTATALILLLATNLLHPTMVDISRPRASALPPVGTPIRLAGGLTVTADLAPIEETRCAPTSLGGYVQKWVLPVHLRVTASHGQHLVQMTNVDWWAASVALTRAVRPVGLPYVPDVIVSARHRQAQGWLWLLLTSPTGAIEYADPTGGGVSGWRFDVHAAHGTSIPGSPCVPAGRRVT